MKRLLCLLAVCLLMLPYPAGADLVWPDSVRLQHPSLVEYVNMVNLCLLRAGSKPVNSLFECYDTFATMGITAMDMADSAEDVEITFQMQGDVVLEAEVRMCNLESFSVTMAAMMAVASGEKEDADLRPFMRIPDRLVNEITTAPNNSIDQSTTARQDDAVQVFASYTPNTYGDGKNWVSMTILFPSRDSLQVGSVVTPPPQATEETLRDGSDDDGDYTPYDEGTHLEVFLTPTPEPDSAAGDAMTKET